MPDFVQVSVSREELMRLPPDDFLGFVTWCPLNGQLLRLVEEYKELRLKPDLEAAYQSMGDLQKQLIGVETSILRLEHVLEKLNAHLAYDSR